MVAKKGSLVHVECKTCGKPFSVYLSRYKLGRGVFCSKECKHNYTPQQKIVNCDYCNKEFIAKKSELKRNKGKYCSRKCAAKDYRNKYSGEQSANWKKECLKGDKRRDKHNSNYRYSDWRLKVYERDDFTCQICGIKGGKLNAHHQFEWAKYPDFRYELWNGVTLCENCHKNEHKRMREEIKNVEQKR